MKKKVVTKRILTVLLSALLAFSTIGSDMIVAGATPINTEETVIEETTEEVFEEDTTVPSDNEEIAEEAISEEEVISEESADVSEEDANAEEEDAEEASEEVKKPVVHAPVENMPGTNNRSGKRPGGSYSEGSRFGNGNATPGSSTKGLLGSYYTFDYNGGSPKESVWGWGLIYPGYVAGYYFKGESVPVPSADSVATYPSNAYELIGWAKSPNETDVNKMLKPGSSFKSGDSGENYYAIYKKKLSVKYVYNGKEAANIAYYKPGESCTLASSMKSSLSRPSYTSLYGWATDASYPVAGTLYKPGDTFKADSDVTLYAVLSETVAFYILKEGKSISTTNYKQDFYPEISQRRSNYEKFVGKIIYKAESFQDVQNGIGNYIIEVPTDAINKYLNNEYDGKVTVDDIKWFNLRRWNNGNSYARVEGYFTSLPAKITYDAGNGQNATGTNKYVDENAAVNKTYNVLSNDTLGFSLEGYNLSGWSLTDDGSSPVGASFEVKDRETTLYAIWTEKEKVTYTVSYVDEDGKAVAEAASDKVKDPTTLDSAKFIKKIDGYEFDADATGKINWKITADNNSIVLKYKTINYNINYKFVEVDEQTGAVINTLDSVMVDPANRTTYTVKDGFTLNNPTKSGYVFLGWKLDENGAYNKEYSVSDGTIGELNFTGYFRESYPITISFWYRVGENGTSSALYNDDKRCTQALLPVRGQASDFTPADMEGLKFVKWVDANGDFITSDITLTADTIDSYAKVDGVYTESKSFYAIYDRLKLVVKPENIDETYTGEAFSIKYTAEDNFENAVEDVNFKVYSDKSCSSEYEISNSFTNVKDSGTYYVRISKGGYTISEIVEVAVNIKKAAPKFTLETKDGSPIEDLYDLIYGGKDKVEFVVKENESNGTISIETEPADVSGIVIITNADGTITIEADKKASNGDITVKVVSTDPTGNYEDATVLLKVTVANGKIKNVNVLGANDSCEYDGKYHSITVEADDTKDGAPTVEYYYIQGNETKEEYKYSTTVPEFINVGTYKVAYRLSMPGFDTIEDVASLTIVPKKVSLKWSDETSFEYNGSEQGVTAEVVGIVEGDKVSVSLDNATAKDAGKYTAEAKELSNSNYAFADDAVKTLDWEITKKEVELTWAAYDTYDPVSHGFDAENGTINAIYSALSYTVTAKVANSVGGDIVVTSGYNTNVYTSVGEYKVSVSELDNDNYVLPENKEVTLKISYLDAEEADITGDKKDGSDWYKGIVTVSKEGFKLTTGDPEDGAVWEDKLTFRTSDSIKYQMMNKEGFITKVFDAEFDIDVTAPSNVTITVNNNKFTEALNKITFGLFFKKITDVVITAEDETNGSGLDYIEYQVVKMPEDFDADGTWTKGDKFSIDPNTTYIVYARACDKAGNVSSIINSNGIVLYTDAEANTTNVDYVRGTHADADVLVTLNNNTINTVTVVIDGEDVVLKEGTDYKVSDNKITLTGDFLETLEGDEDGIVYKASVSYNPLGKDYVDASGNDAPATTEFTITVKVSDEALTIGEIGKTYDGKPVAAPTVTSVSGRTEGITILYKVQGEDDSTYTKDAPVNAGKYTVKASIEADSTYASAFATKDFEIKSKEVTLVWSGADSEGHTEADFKFTYSSLNYVVKAEAEGVIDGDKVSVSYAAGSQNDMVNVGDYKAVVEGVSNTNYCLSPNAETEKAWSISYLADDAVADVTGDKIIDTSDWFTGDVTIKKDGYEIIEEGGTWSTELVFTKDTDNGEVKYRLKNREGFITDVKTASYKIDSVSPEAEITVGTNSFKEVISTITFGLFFKDSVDVKITGTDATPGSGIDMVKYQKLAKDEKFDVNGAWTDSDSFSAKANDAFVVYALVSDKAGHKVVINSDGIVVYTDAVAVTESIEYVRSAKAAEQEDKNAEVTLNGNTIKAVFVDGEELPADAYSVEDGKITLKGSFLNTLEGSKEGTAHKAYVKYNPFGFEVQAGSTNEPATTSFEIVVKKRADVVAITNNITKTYNGKAVKAPKYTVESERTDVVIEYKKASEDETAYTTTAPKKVGSYVVRVSVAEDDNYLAASAEKDFKIKKQTNGGGGGTTPGGDGGNTPGGDDGGNTPGGDGGNTTPGGNGGNTTPAGENGGNDGNADNGNDGGNAGNNNDANTNNNADGNNDAIDDGNGTVIDENEVPLSDGNGTEITDGEVPLSSGAEKPCCNHWILLGLIILYGAYEAVLAAIRAKKIKDAKEGR